MDYQVLIVIIAGLLTLTIGIEAAKGVYTLRDFAVSRGHFSRFAMVCSIVATSIGGGTIVGMAEKSFIFGPITFLAGVGFCLLYLLLGVFIAPRAEKYKDALTLGDVVAVHYGNLGKVCVGLLWFIFCIGLIVTQINALGKVLTAFTHLNPFWNTMIGVGVVIFYCSLGGIRAVVKTDILQFLILIICLSLALCLSVYYSEGLSMSVPHLKTMTTTQGILFFFTFLLSGMIYPPIFQFFLLSNSGASARQCFVISAFFCFLCFSMGTFFGLLAFASNPGLHPSEAVPYIFNHLLPIWMRPFAVTALLAVIVSTVDSFINSLSISVVNDVVKPLFNRSWTFRSELFIARLSCILLGIIVLTLSLNDRIDTIDILLYSQQVWVPTVGGILVAMFFGRVISQIGFVSCILVGLASTLVWNGFSLQQTTGISALFPSFFLNMALFWSLYFTENRSKKGVCDVT